MSVSVPVREYERTQILDFLSDLVQMYDEQALDERAKRLATFGDILSNPVPDDVTRYEYEFDSEDDVELLSRSLRQLGEAKASWLASKIAKRCDLTPADMSFSTSVPIGAIMEMGMPLDTR